MINDRGEVIFMTGNDDNNFCGSSSSSCFVKSGSHRVPKNTWVHLAVVKDKK